MRIRRDDHLISIPVIPTASPSAASSSKTPTSGSTGYPAGKEDICRARDQLRTSIDQLTSTQLLALAEGTNAIKAGVDQVQRLRGGEGVPRRMTTRPR